MKPRLILLLAGLIAAIRLASLPAGEPPAPLTIYTAIEVEFGTESGQVYQLQGSSNLLDWASIGDPVFGVGRTVTRMFSTRGGGEVVFQSYRLDVTAGPTNGFAPWTLAGLTLSLDDRPDGDRTQFLSETNGVDLGTSPDPFTYVFSRLDLNSVTADVQRDAERHELLTLTFTAPGLGTWMREEFRKGKLKGRHVGTFTVIGTVPSDPNLPPVTGTNAPPVVPVEIPAALTGLAYVFQDGAKPDRLNFTTASTGTELGDDSGDDSSGDNRSGGFQYTYVLNGTNTATLVVTFKPDRFTQYDLTFSNGAQGTFVRRDFHHGVLKDTDRGSFSAAGVVPGGSGGGGNPPPADGIMPTNTLSGLTYTLKISEKPDRLVFADDTTGTEFGDDDGDTEPNVFTYTYRVAGEHAAQLVVRFKADKWEEYDLTFAAGNAGNLVQRRFRKGILDRTDAGTFAGQPTAP